MLADSAMPIFEPHKSLNLEEELRIIIHLTKLHKIFTYSCQHSPPILDHTSSISLLSQLLVSSTSNLYLSSSKVTYIAKRYRKTKANKKPNPLARFLDFAYRKNMNIATVFYVVVISIDRRGWCGKIKFPAVLRLFCECIMLRNCQGIFCFEYR